MSEDDLTSHQPTAQPSHVDLDAKRKHDDKVIRRGIGALALILAAVIVSFIGQALLGAHNSGVSARKTCNSTEINVYVPLANGFRYIEQAFSSAKTDKANLTGAAQALNHVLDAIDTHIDPADAKHLNPTGKQILARLAKHDRAYSCARSHPAPSVIPFF